MTHQEQVKLVRTHCLRGRRRDVNAVMVMLDDRTSLPMTKVIDYYLGQVRTRRGVRRIRYFLFNGTQIQRNYCTLFFARRNDWGVVNRAFDLGLIDATQAYAR